MRLPELPELSACPEFRKSNAVVADAVGGEADPEARLKLGSSRRDRPDHETCITLISGRQNRFSTNKTIHQLERPLIGASLSIFLVIVVSFVAGALHERDLINRQLMIR